MVPGIAGRAAVVIGGSSGPGLACCQALAAVAFRASDLAGFLTGQVIQPDGGMTRSLV